MKSLLTLSALCFFAIASLQAQVAASFTSSDSAGCPALCSQFTNTTPNTISCKWNFGDSSTSNPDTTSFPNPAHCFFSPGTYTVTLTVHTSSGNGTISQYVHVYPQPVAQFTWTHVTGNTYTFTSTSTGNVTSLFWVLGGASTPFSTTNPTTYTFPNSGGFSVMLGVKNSYGCVDSTGQYMVTGTDDLHLANDLKIYPTPSANGIYTMELEGFGAETGSYSILNSLGQLLFTNEQLTKTQTVDLSAEPNGIYFIRLQKGSETCVRKVILQR
jgi:PKD repeat protein